MKKLNNFFSYKIITMLLLISIVFISIIHINIISNFYYNAYNDKFILFRAGFIEQYYKSFTNQIIVKNLYKQYKINNLIPKIDIEIQKNKIEALNKDLPKSGFEYQNAKLEFNNKNYEIQVRYKGYSPHHWFFKKKSYKIKFLNKQPFGHEKLTLTNPKSNSMLNNYIGSYIANKFNILSPKEELLNVYLNKKYIGVYLSTESIDKEFLKSRNLKIGDIYEAENMRVKQLGVFNIKNVFTSPYLWEKIVSDDKNENNIYTFIININDILNSNIKYSHIKSIVDYNNAISFNAVMSILQTLHYDEMHNLKFYFNTDISKFQQISWDNSAFRFISLPDVYPDIISNDYYTVLHKSPEFILEKYKIIYKKIKQNLLNDIIQEINNTYEKIHTSVYNDIYKGSGVVVRTTMTNKEWELSIINLKEKITHDITTLEEYITQVNVSANNKNEKLDFYIDNWGSVILKEFDFQDCVNIPVIYKDMNLNEIIDAEDKQINNKNLNIILYSGRIKTTADRFINKVLKPAPEKYTFLLSHSECKLENVTFENALTKEKIIINKFNSPDKERGEFTIHPWILEQELIIN